MRGYVTRRVLLLIPTLLIVSVIVFLMIRLIPGDVIDAMLGEMVRIGGGGAGVGDALDREALERMLGLDVPIHVQYGRWIGDIFLHGSLGEALRGGPSVTERIFQRLPITFELGALALITGLLIALPIGVYSAIRQDTPGDYIGRSLAIILISVPSFWTGTIIMVYPSIWWGWAPSMELISFADDPLGNLGMFIIPALIMGTGLAGVSMRMTRTMMLEVLRQDYIRTAWAKGLKERAVIVRHALKNAFIPVVTIIGFQLPILVGGSIIMEQIFVLPGVGRLFLQAIQQRDYPMVSGINLFVATVVIGINLLVDISYAYLDPRVKYG